MAKKLIVLAMALAAIAAIVPAAAGAAVLKQGTEFVPNGTIIKGTSGTNKFEGLESLHTETPIGPIECEDVILEGPVKDNGELSGTVRGEGISGNATGCQSLGEPVNVAGVSIALLEANVAEETGHAIATFEYDALFFEETLDCHFEAKEAPVTYSGDVVTVPTTTLTATPEICGNPEEPATITGKVTLSTTNNTPVTIE